MEDGVSKPFGWYIEVESQGYRWFTMEQTKVSFWAGRKGVRIRVLYEHETIEPDNLPEQMEVPLCDHVPDVMKRCIKCRADLSISGMLTKKS